MQETRATVTLAVPILTGRPLAPGRHSSHGFVNSAQVLDALQLRPGLRVLDAGCGPGDWALECAARVSPGGWLIAADIWREGLRWMNQQRGQRPAFALCTDIARPLPLPDQCMDRVLVALVLHHLAPRGAAAMALRELRRVLRPDGALVALEFAPVAPPPGPPLTVRMVPAEVRTLLAEAGFGATEFWPVAPHVLLYGTRRDG